MQGVVVDFHTLYDPVALAGVVLSYVPVYKRIYASKHSFWLEASPIRQDGWVPIDGFKQLVHGLDDPGVEWLRHWCQNALKIPENSIVKGNLYASVALIQRLMESDLLRLIPFEDKFIQFSGELLKHRDLLTSLDTMMSFGEDKENGFYLSPDLGHGFQLGTALIMKSKDDFRFSTNNIAIKAVLDQVLPMDGFDVCEKELNIDIPVGSTFMIEDVFRLLEQENTRPEQKGFFSRVEESENDLVYFVTQLSLDKDHSGLKLGGKILGELWRLVK